MPKPLSASHESGEEIPEEQIPDLRRQLNDELERLRIGITTLALNLLAGETPNPDAPTADAIRRDPVGSILTIKDKLTPEIEKLIHGYRLRLLALKALRGVRWDGAHEQRSLHRSKPPALEGFAAPGSLIEQNIIVTLEDPDAICTLAFIRKEIFRDWPAYSWQEVAALLEFLVSCQIIERKVDEGGVFFIRGANFEARKRQLFETEQNRRSRKK